MARQFDFRQRQEFKTFAVFRLNVLDVNWSEYRSTELWRLQRVGIVSCLPVGAVERAVTDGFGEMVRCDLVAAIEVGNRATDSQNLVMRAGGEAHAIHRRFEQRFGVRVELAVIANLLGGHLAVC